MGKVRKSYVTPEKIEELMEMFANMPEECTLLTDDDFVLYVMEELSGSDLQRVEDHLSSCEQCSAEMDFLKEGSKVWQGEEGEKRLKALEQRCREAMQTSLSSQQ